MNKLILAPFMLCISSCIGTEILNREYDKDRPYPDLHSVPERPAEVDFKIINQEMTMEEADQEKMLKFNQEWRQKYLK